MRVKAKAKVELPKSGYTYSTSA